jgi:hypothetical protein
VATTTLLRPAAGPRTDIAPRRPPVVERTSVEPPARATNPLACRIRLVFPDREWIAELSRRFPELAVEVLQGLPLPGRCALSDLRVPVVDGVSWAAEVRGLTGVVEVEPLGASAGHEHLRVVHRGASLLEVFARWRVAPTYPYPVRRGVAILTFAAGERTLRDLIADLRETSVGVSLASVQAGPRWSEAGVLTSRQKQVLERAMGLGYFDVPRRVSLTRLAQHLGVAKSTLSALLAVIERKVLLEAMLREGLDTSPARPSPVP